VGVACLCSLQRRGAREVELSRIPESNASACSIVESIGARACKRYRFCDRRLDKG
jgi:hypothetical protein